MIICGTWCCEENKKKNRKIKLKHYQRRTKVNYNENIIRKFNQFINYHKINQKIETQVVNCPIETEAKRK